MANSCDKQSAISAQLLLIEEEKLSKFKMLDWVNNSLHSNYQTVEELGDGAAFAQLMDLLLPGTVSLNEVVYSTYSEQDSIHNFRILHRAFMRAGCNKEIPVHKLIRSQPQDNLEFLQWFKKFFDTHYDGHDYNALEARGGNQLINNQFKTAGDDRNKELVLALVNNEEPRYDLNISLLDYSWSTKMLQLVNTKAKLKESFAWLSTIGGGFSALGEKDTNFSMRAGILSLGQQLRLAERLGDDRLKVLCHCYAALASIQMNNKEFCRKYLREVVAPLIAVLPCKKDQVLAGVIKHIAYRIGKNPLKNRVTSQSRGISWHHASSDYPLEVAQDCVT